jgi:hypothetical protein
MRAKPSRLTPQPWRKTGVPFPLLAALPLCATTPRLLPIFVGTLLLL